MSAVCKKCDGNSYTDVPNSNTTCTACPAGQYANANKTACGKCQGRNVAWVDFKL